MHPTLLIGPSDWKPERMPKAEFLCRIDELWQSCPDASRALVYGNPRHHAELAYLTNFIPKLEPAVALLSRSDQPRLFVGGGANMLGAARPLTWIQDIVPLKELEGLRSSDCVLIGGEYMSASLRRIIGDAPDVTPQVWAQMRHKSSAELAAMREACITLSAAIVAIADAKQAGASVTTAILAGERAANDHGAQDVRTLFSLNGGRTLQPFDTLFERAVDPLQVYIAVRIFNYWAESFALLSERVCPAAEKADALLRAVLPMIKPGTSTSIVSDLVAVECAPYQCHPVTKGALANSIGLALEETAHTNLLATFEAGEVYAVKIGLTDSADQHAIASAMIALRRQGSEVLWSSESLTRTN